MNYSEPFEIIPQHYPLWVREEYRDRNGGPNFYQFLPVIGWKWTTDDGEAVLHPVVVAEYYTGAYSESGAVNFVTYQITDTKEIDQS